MSNKELMSAGTNAMDDTDRAIEQSKLVVGQTIDVGTQTAVNLKGQNEQMRRIVNDLDTVHFSLKKASQLVKEMGRQVSTDKCIMLFLILTVCGVIAIIIVKLADKLKSCSRHLILPIPLQQGTVQFRFEFLLLVSEGRKTNLRRWSRPYHRLCFKGRHPPCRRPLIQD